MTSFSWFSNMARLVTWMILDDLADLGLNGSQIEGDDYGKLEGTFLELVLRFPSAATLRLIAGAVGIYTLWRKTEKGPSSLRDSQSHNRGQTDPF